MEAADVIIIGAGASGLMAAYELVKKEKKIIILEARDRIGGRILTIPGPAGNGVMEGGAEFIHGNLPLTFKMLKEANLPWQATDGDSWIHKNGELKKGEDLIENWDVLLSRVKKVKADIPLSVFLKDYLGEPEYEDLRRSVTSFVEGYDSADVTRTSTLSMKAEWSNEDQWDQYRPEGGYARLLNYLETKCRQGAASIHLSAVAKQVRWKKDVVEVVTHNRNSYHASKLIVTVPLGILQADAGATAAIAFSPALPGAIAAAKEMGFGAVIKILLCFDHPFWNDITDTQGKQMKKMGYLFSNAFIPTWWTQYPKESSLLTGWLGGPKAAALKDADDETILSHAIGVLSEIFKMDEVVLRQRLSYSSIFNWTADPFTLGAYAYPTLQSAEAKKVLQTPVEDTIFFTGEALGTAMESGTVEVALEAGEAVVKRILRL